MMRGRSDIMSDECRRVRSTKAYLVFVEDSSTQPGSPIDRKSAELHRDQVRQELAAFGYIGDLAITDEGRATARHRLDKHRASKATRERR
jgi:hypothetical protein